MNRCGTCEHTQPTQVIDEVVCWGGPVQLMPIPTGPQSVQFTPMPQPIVKRNRQACGVWKRKVLTAANDLVIENGDGAVSQ
jgi:hypothetical protein